MIRYPYAYGFLVHIQDTGHLGTRFKDKRIRSRQKLLHQFEGRRVDFAGIFGYLAEVVTLEGKVKLPRLDTDDVTLVHDGLSDAMPVAVADQRNVSIDEA